MVTSLPSISIIINHRERCSGMYGEGCFKRWDGGCMDLSVVFKVYCICKISFKIGLGICKWSLLWCDFELCVLLAD
jgi:hypothetical protein